MWFSKRHLVLVLLIFAVAGSVVAERVLVEAIMIRVNDRVLSLTDFANRLRQEFAQMPEAPPPDQVEKLAGSLLDALVEELIILERAEERHVEVPQEAIDEAVDNLRRENNLADEAAFEQALAQVGLTMDTIRERYRQTILLQRTVQSEVQTAEITKEEIRQLYEKNKADLYAIPAKIELEQLFFPIEDDDSDEQAVRRRVAGLIERVRAGADLTAEATLAGVELQDLGAIPGEDLRADLRASLVGLENGDLTEPVDTAGGIQVLRLVRRHTAGFKPFSEVEDQLYRVESARRYQQQATGFVEGLKKEYLVEVHRDLLPQVLERISYGN